MPAREPTRDGKAPSSAQRPEGTQRETTPPRPGFEAAPEASGGSRADALALIPAGSFILTAAYGESRGGVLARWVQQVSSGPPMVVVAIEKGQPLSPVIRDSRRFALCQLGHEDRVLRRMFEVERRDPLDPFLGLPTKLSPGGAPILLKAMSWLDCELTRHLDVEGNCELYIGLVHSGAVLQVPAAAPLVIPGREAPSPLRAPEANGHANGHLNGHTNGKANGHTNGHAAGRPNGKSNGHASLPRLPKRREPR